MRPLKLHTKTTVLTSAITIAVLAAVLALVNPRFADILSKEQRDRAELQAINLAEQISHLPTPRDPQMLAHAANIVRGARKDIVAVRIWERVGGKYVEVAAAADSGPAEDIPDETRNALRNGLASSTSRPLPEGTSATLYRVFAPITEQGRYSGAVELVERLDTAPFIAGRFERVAIWMAGVAVILITLATYLLFRQLVYRPIERLLWAMSRAEAGDLQVEAPLRAPDELGLLSRSFNRMIARIREMTGELEAQRSVLEERVSEATAQLEHRNEQLEEINRELSQTALRMTELERLAAAGQTVAQFAHEVGTPLNLISGHVQLLRARLTGDKGADGRLETISAQIERIERIVRGMLDRTRPLAVELSPLDLNALLLRTFDATAPALDTRGVRLASELAQNLPLVAGDADRLQQVFINLINNALDAMPEGGELRVRTGLEGAGSNGNAGPVTPGLIGPEKIPAPEKIAGPEKHAPAPSTSPISSTSPASSTSEEVALASSNSATVFVEFADTGCGMGEQLRARIFDPFYTTKELGYGTGLGLVVVRQIVRQHGGDVEVESAPGQGSRFHLRFPGLATDNAEARGQRSEVSKEQKSLQTSNL